MSFAETTERRCICFQEVCQDGPGNLSGTSSHVGPQINQERSLVQKGSGSQFKAALTLRYLATGDSYRMLMYGFQVAHNIIFLVDHDVCQAIIEEYAEVTTACQTTPEEWQEITKQFGCR